MNMIIAALSLALAAQAPPPHPDVADLAWLGGAWETADGTTEEDWVAPRGGIMLGLGRTIRGGALRDYEFLRIQAGTDGVPVYWGSPNGERAVGFRLVRLDTTSVSFENPDHDYPQRIAYRRDGDSMVATISAIDGSHAMRWNYRRR